MLPQRIILINRQAVTTEENGICILLSVSLCENGSGGQDFGRESVVSAIQEHDSCWKQICKNGV